MNIVVNLAFARLIELAHSLPLCLGFAQFFDRCLKHSAIKLLRLKVKSETINIRKDSLRICSQIFVAEKEHLVFLS
jgi:hypothetical protein